jgi:ABC-type multidrug transport system fused ATPase/permease subunit
MKNPYFNLIHSVWTNGRPWRHIIVGYYIAYIIAQAFLSFSPYAFGRTVDVLQNFAPNRLIEVITWMAVSVAVLLLFWFFHGPARVKEREVALKIQQALRLRLYEQLTQLPLKWHQDHHSGNIISRLNRASLALFRFAGEQFVYIETIVKFIVSSVFLLWISLPVGLLSLVTCAVSISTVLVFDKKLIPLYDKQNEIDNHVGAVLFDYISNMTTILTLRLGDLTRKNLFQRMMSVWPAYKKDCVINEVKWFSMGIVLNTLQSLILIAYIVFSLHQEGAILIGTVVMIFRYQWDLSEVFYNFSANYSEIVRMNTDLQGLDPILHDIVKFAPVSQGGSIHKHWKSIQIQDLDFYHSTGKRNRKLLNQLSLTIKRGEKIALIGSSGTGKSTLLNVIRGLYVPDQVKLTVDDKVFSTLEPLQAITTLIPQDPELFENTIAFNITLDVPTTAKEIDRIIQLAGFAKVMQSLQYGLDTDIREKGMNLSVGQKQRLALTRGLFAARFSSLILMDEPTSSVDLPTEKQIISDVIEAFPESTIMVSLHRLHLLPRFDRIIMLDHGKVVADGLSAELLAQPGPVFELWKAYQK